VNLPHYQEPTGINVDNQMESQNYVPEMHPQTQLFYDPPLFIKQLYSFLDIPSSLEEENTPEDKTLEPLGASEYHPKSTLKENSFPQIFKSHSLNPSIAKISTKKRGTQSLAKKFGNSSIENLLDPLSVLNFPKRKQKMSNAQITIKNEGNKSSGLTQMIPSQNVIDLSEEKKKATCHNFY